MAWDGLGRVEQWMRRGTHGEQGIDSSDPEKGTKVRKNERHPEGAKARMQGSKR